MTINVSNTEIRTVPRNLVFPSSAGLAFGELHLSTAKQNRTIGRHYSWPLWRSVELGTEGNLHCVLTKTARLETSDLIQSVKIRGIQIGLQQARHGLCRQGRLRLRHHRLGKGIQVDSAYIAVGRQSR